MDRIDYIPDGWVICKWMDTYKVFCSWTGGYVASDNWRLNSSIKTVEQDEEGWWVINKGTSSYYLSPHGYGRVNVANLGTLANLTSKGVDVFDEEDGVSVLNDFMERAGGLVNGVEFNMNDPLNTKDE